MKTQYAIFNPANGSYTFKDTYEDACAELASVSYEFYKQQTHGQPCSYVEIQDDGSQIWRDGNGVIMPSPDDIKKEQLKVAALSTRTYEDIPKVTI